MKNFILVLVIIALLACALSMKREKVIVKKAEKLSDFKKVSKVVYKVYGDTYPYKTVYNPRENCNCYLSGKSSSYIAVDKWRLLGHVALIKDRDKNICEMATAFVNPKYRGNGILMELVMKIMKDCSYRGDAGVYVNSVCGHTYSQRVACKAGMSECAIMLKKMVPLNFKSIDGQWFERESLVTSFKYLKDVKEKDFYLCRKHRKIVGEIYDELGVKVNFIDDKSKDGVQYLNSKIDVEMLEDESASIKIIEAGVDVISKVIECLNHLVQENTKAIVIVMRLHERSTKYLSKELEKYGVFFSGILPGDDDEDVLLMQYVTEDINYDKVKLLSNNGKRLLEYIKEQYYYVNERKEINEF